MVRTLPFHGNNTGSNPVKDNFLGYVAQLAEQWTFNPLDLGSSPSVPNYFKSFEFLLVLTRNLTGKIAEWFKAEIC